MMKSRTRIIAIAVAILLFGGAIFFYYRSNRAQIPTDDTSKGKSGAEAGKGKGRGGDKVVPVDVYIASLVTIDEGIRAMGSLVANEEVDVTSEVSGKVMNIYFDEGARIAKGAIMLKVNDDDLQSQLKRAQFQQKLLKEKLERGRILLEKDAISGEAFDQMETDYNVIQADIQLLEVRIAKTQIRAPFGGVIGFRYISPGSYLQPGTAIAKLVDYSKLKLEFSIPEKYISSNLKGTEVQFTTENSTRTNQARVYAVDSKVDLKTRTITLRALYNNTDMSLRPGMFAKVTLGQRSGNTIAVPTEAIISEAQGKSVYIVRNNRAVITPIVTTTRTDAMVEVTKGLSVGDSVIITGLMYLRDGSSIQVNN